MPLILANWKAEIGRTVVRGQPSQITHKDPISKKGGAKWPGRVAQVIECLLCKHETLIQTSVPPKK
jgi:hypothetical protein